MNEFDNPASVLRDQRLAEHAVGPAPVWLWTADATRILWTNAAGAVLFHAATPKALTERRFDQRHPIAVQIARLAASLTGGGAARLARLPGIGRGIGQFLTCACSHFDLGDGTAAILVVATEPAGGKIPLSDRIAAFFATSETPLAAFSPDGHLIHANASASPYLSNATTLGGLHGDHLAATALSSGHAQGEIAGGTLTLDRAGTGASAVLIATFAPPVVEATPATPSAEVISAATETLVEVAAADVPAVTDETPVAPVAAEPAPTPSAIEVAQERRHPLRFVWQIDADGNFTLSSDEFVTLAGPRTATTLGLAWSELANALALDPQGQVARAIASRDTWSGITVAWPLDGLPDTLPVELSGLPVFDRDRSFRGYRGFGVCRDLNRLAEAAAIRAAAQTIQAAPEPAPETLPPAAEQAAAEQAPTEQAVVPEAPAPAAATTSAPPTLSIVPQVQNVVPFPSGANEQRRPTLTPVERKAFQDIAKVLGAEPPSTAAEPAVAESVAPPPSPPAPLVEQAPAQELPAPAAEAIEQAEPIREVAAARGSSIFAAGPDLVVEEAEEETHDHAILDRLPIGIAVYRNDALLYVNKALLDWSGYADLDSLINAGGLEHLLGGNSADAFPESDGAARPLALLAQTGDAMNVDARILTIAWTDGPALLLALTRQPRDEQIKAAELATRAAEADARELKSILDTATDGVIVLDREGRVLSSNRSAEALFGYESHELFGRPFTDLFAPESHRGAVDYLDGLLRNGVASVLNDGREVIGRVRQGGLIPLFMTMGRVGDQGEKFCAVFRDITQWKRAEEELLNAKRQAEKASSAKSDFLAKISHEIRTPLNAIIGFSEVMMEERFGPIGNDRYRGYLKDINTSGEHLISLINDLLDLSKIEAGKLDLTFDRVQLNDITQQCVALMQPQANRERIIIRTSLAPTLPPVVADARSIRQIVLNLLSNAIKFTGPGGQVIVSTALTERAEAVLRVRDTGIGMSEKDIETALEPFRQLATSGPQGSGGTGLGLPLTKALTEANRATFTIRSAVNAGTLVEIAFPPTRVLAE